MSSDSASLVAFSSIFDAREGGEGTGAAGVSAAPELSGDFVLSRPARSCSC